MIGIDFGTTNSAVAAYSTANQEVTSSPYEPTVLYFEEGNGAPIHVGFKAIEKYIEHGLRGRFIRSIKSLLHFESFSHTFINGTRYRAEDLVAILLENLLEKGKELTGGMPDKIVLGRPVKFSSNPERDALAQQRLAKAAELAGMKNVVFQLEPIAAAFTYERLIKKEQLVFVGDFGGGTADFTLMRLGKGHSGGDRRGDIIATHGVRVGGDDLDADIAWNKVVEQFGLGLEYDSNGRGKWLPVPSHHYSKFCRWENHAFLNSPTMMMEIEKYFDLTRENARIANFMQVLQHNLGYSLFRQIEESKKDLSTQDKAWIKFAAMDVDIKESIDLGEFGQFINGRVMQIREAVELLLTVSGIDVSQVDAVFLTGGTSLVRPVRAVMEDIFGLHKINDHDAFSSVAEGLALSGRE